MDLRAVTAELERRGKRKRAPGSVLIPLPLYGGRAFAARYRVLPPDDIAKMGDAFDEDKMSDVEANTEAALTMLADACRHIEARDPETGKWEPVTAPDGRRVRFDVEFAEALGLDLSEQSMAAVVRAVWTVQDEDDDAPMFNGAAVSLFAQRLLTWMQDTNRPMAEAILGEAHGGPTSSGPVAPPEQESTPASSSPPQTEG